MKMKGMEWIVWGLLKDKGSQGLSLAQPETNKTNKKECIKKINVFVLGKKK